MPKIIGFLGSSPADICMYAAYALQNTGSSVCVIDNSIDGVLYGCIPSPDADAESVTYHNVDFMRFLPFTRWYELDNYAYILVQLGERAQELCLAACSMRVLVIDCERRNQDFYSRFMKESGMAMQIVLRGFCSGTLSVGKIRERFESGNGLVQRWFLLPLHEMDEAYRISMQYEHVSKFPYISWEMEHALVQILILLHAGSRAGVVRAVKNAKKGRMAAFWPDMEKGKEIECYVLE